MKTPQSESALQANCAIWFKNTYRSLRLLFFMIPNDGKKNIITATTDKARGLTPGIPDTFLSIPSQGFHGLYIEFKTLMGSLSPEQQKAIEQLQTQGYRVELVRTEAEFRELIADYLGQPYKTSL